MCIRDSSSDVEQVAKRLFTKRSPRTLALARRLEHLFEQVERYNGAALAEHREFISEEIGRIILCELSQADQRVDTQAPAQFERVLARAMNVLSDVDRLPITVGELCEAAYTSHSTLHRAFSAQFGVSPKAYIRARCLSAVRDELAGTPPETSITDIANRWGFWHGGQFAKDFKAQFGCLPSEVRRRRS